MGAKNPAYCKHCDERGTVRVKRGDVHIMEKCRRCDGTGFKRSAKAWFPKITRPLKAASDGDSNG